MLLNVRHQCHSSLLFIVLLNTVLHTLPFTAPHYMIYSTLLNTIIHSSTLCHSQRQLYPAHRSMSEISSGLISKKYVRGTLRVKRYVQYSMSPPVITHIIEVPLLSPGALFSCYYTCNHTCHCTCHCPCIYMSF